MILSLIAAIGKNNELGKGNQLLWNLPADMKHFRETTTGHPVIMGRKTYESIGRPLPNRRNVVVTRDASYTKDGVEVVHSLEEALELFKTTDEEVFIIGGGELYRQAIAFAEKLYITKIDNTFDADTFFPEIDSTWIEISHEAHEPDEKNLFPYTFYMFEKQ